MKIVCQNCGAQVRFERPLPLTQHQSDLYHFIVVYSGRHGVPPSFNEMMRHMGLKSKSGIHRILEALVERGFIRRLYARARAIEVIR